MSRLNKTVARFRKNSRRRERSMHPEDAQNERDGWKEGEKYAPEFCEQRRDWFVQMIAVYPDGDAHELLDALREEFWSTERDPEAKR